MLWYGHNRRNRPGAARERYLNSLKPRLNLECPSVATVATLLHLPPPAVKFYRAKVVPLIV